MEAKILDKIRLDAFLLLLSRDAQLWVPSLRNGLCNFRVYDGENVPEKKMRTRLSVKKLALPQKEWMFRYPRGRDVDPRNPFEEIRPEGDVTVFGVSPCDARALSLTALVYLSNSENSAAPDPYFQQRMNNLTLIGWGCNVPCPTCFCHAVGGHPFGEEGLDVIITDLGEKLLVKPLTPKGEKIIAKYPMPAADAASLEAAAEIARKARSGMPPGLKLELPLGRELQTLFDLPLWEETARRCLNCGVCTYLCPTCYCFDILDQNKDGAGGRYRVWDSCMFALFTRHASGQNPRPTKRERLRQRFMHKLKYFPEIHSGRVGCVGCGRCVLYCPVNIDIREIAAGMSAL